MKTTAQTPLRMPPAPLSPSLRWPGLPLPLPLLAASSLLLQITAPGAPAAGGTRADYARAASGRERWENKVFRSRVEPRWLEGGPRFTYRVQTGPDTHELVLVDPEAGTRSLITDPSLLPGPAPVKTSTLGLSPRPTRTTGPACVLTFVNSTSAEVEIFWIDSTGHQQSYGRLGPGTGAPRPTYAGHRWMVKDASGQPLAALTAGDDDLRILIDGPSQNPRGDSSRPDSGMPPSRRDGGGENISPDGKWKVIRRDSNLFLAPASGDGPETPLTTDGKEGDGYLPGVTWSPDSRALAATRVQPGQPHPVHMVESSPRDQVQPRLFTHNYLKPGDQLPAPRPVLIELGEPPRVTMPGNELFPVFFTENGHLPFRWNSDGSAFTFPYNQRGHQLFRLLSVDRASAVVRTVAEETSSTFIDYTQKTWHHFLDGTRELLWMSERSGWCHLHLIDSATGDLKNAITQGEWVVRGVESVDEAARQVWFMAGGLRPGEDPYHQHLCRVNFDGSGFVRLTEGDGTHRVVFSPDRKWILDTWSRADHPPVTELREAATGRLVLELERAGWSALLEAGWAPPERFTAKGRDGITDIHGTIVRPGNFDPARSWPVVEEIYAGPHGSFAAKEFGLALRQHALAELGFVVVQMDGMGTNHRGKKFHDVAWKNLADSGFPDRIAWMKAAAATRPWMNLERVGIFGGSAGGQSAMRALIDHGDFYKAAVADCGCHDNRMDKIWWNEQWMGWPVDESYARSSNVDHAHRLQGHLLLTVGELDTNVDPASTMQVVNALIKAGRDFDLLVVPGSNHGAGESPYANRRRMDFLVRHLMGHEPRLDP